MLFRSGKSWIQVYFLRRGWLVPRRQKLRRRPSGWNVHSAVPAECLEERVLLSTITVTSLNDNTTVDGQVTLREAIEAANTDASVDGSVAGQAGVQNQIVFSPGLSGPIELDSVLGELEISSSLTITGNGAANTTLDAQQNSRIFLIDSGAGDVTLSDMTLENGKTTAAGRSSAGGAGGAIFSATAGILTLSGDDLSGNSTTGNLASGGAIFADGPVTIVNSTLSGNSTSGPNAAYGGAIYSAAAVTVSASTLSGNSTSGIHSYGGALFAFGGIQLTNSTVTGNGTSGSGSNAGAVWSGAALTATNSTIAQNSASSGQGGGIYQWTFDPNPVVTLKNTIVAQNADIGTAPDLSIIGSATVTMTHSLIGDNTGSTLTAAPVGRPDINGNLIGTTGALIDPKLGALASNGGPTQTMALLTGSPAIDAGSATGAVDPTTGDPLTSDQRGSPFPRNAGLGVDIGAYEVPPSLIVTSADDTLDAVYDAAHFTLRDALALANADPGADTITFDPSVNGTPIDLTLGELVISDTVTITGSGAANTIIDAQQNSRLFEITSAAGDVTIDSVTLENGKTTANSASGGAIQALSTGTLSILNSIVTGNSVVGNGATGGAISDNRGYLAVTNSTIANNSTAGYAGYGGAIGSEFGYVTITDSTISGNSTTGPQAGGGAIAADTLIVSGSTFSANYTSDNYARGGAITALHDVTITSSTFTGNSTKGGHSTGGAVDIVLGGLTVTSSTFTGNFTLGRSSNGGAIYSYHGDVTVIDSTIARNYASSAAGGGIYAYKTSAAVTLTNSILALNTDRGAAPNLFVASGAAVTVTSSLIGDKTGTSLVAAPVGSPDANGNLIGTGLAPIDPLLGTLANNGGPTGTLALLAGSPAGGAGIIVNDIHSVPITVDQRGNTRFSGGVDIGAYQSPTVASVGRSNPATSPVHALSVTFVVTFNEPVENVGASDFSVNVGSVSNVASVSSTVYHVTVNGLTAFTGTLTLGFSSSQTITDLVGLPVVNTTPTGADVDTYAVDNNSPVFTGANSTIFATGLAGSFTVAASSLFTVTLSESIADVLPGNVTFNPTTGVLGGTPLAGTNGVYILHFTASNGVTPNATQTFTLIVTPQFSFAGEYGVTGGSPALATITQNGSAITLNGSSTASATITNNSQILVNGADTATYGNSSIVFTSGTLAGQTWTKLNLPSNYVGLSTGVATQVTQNGSSLTFSVPSLNVSSSGHWISPTQVVATDWNQTGTVGSGKITWSGGGVWAENVALNGSNNGSGRTTIAATFNSFATSYNFTLGVPAAQMVQNGSSLTFIGLSTGVNSPGFWIDPTHVRATAWGQVGTVGAGGSITWSGGSVWTVAPAPAAVTANYNLTGGVPSAQVIQNGALVTFLGVQSGVTSPGFWISSTQIYATAWNQVATVGSGGSITWSGGNAWTGTTRISPPAGTTIANYNFNNLGLPAAQVIQNGTSLTFVGVLANVTSPGYWISPTQVYASAWGQVGTVSAGGSITWSSGSVWVGTTPITPYTGVVVVTLTDSNGLISHASLTSATTLIGLDGEMTGLTATRLNGNLFWSNGALWSGFDFDALNALFEMGTGYP